jgi:hypothetical protein
MVGVLRERLVAIKKRMRLEHMRLERARDRRFVKETLPCVTRRRRLAARRRRSPTVTVM